MVDVEVDVLVVGAGLYAAYYAGFRGLSGGVVDAPPEGALLRGAAGQGTSRLGSPGGSMKTGPMEADTPRTLELPANPEAD